MYIKDNKSVSIKDSLFNIRFPESTTHQVNNSKFSNIYFSNILKDNKSKEINFLTKIENINDVVFLVKDNLEKFDWKIDEKSQKKIIKYNCFKATTNFRGREIEAYFTRELPYSTGPFKFYGLPGLILEVRVVGLGYYMWKASSIDLNNKDVVDFKPPISNINVINIKEYVELYDKARENFFKNLPKTNSPGGISKMGRERMTIERIYEWE